MGYMGAVSSSSHGPPWEFISHQSLHLNRLKANDQIFMCSNVEHWSEKSYLGKKSVQNASVSFTLEKSVGTRKSAQVLDSPSYMKKVFITNKVTSHFFITLFESITCTSFPQSTDLSGFTAA